MSASMKELRKEIDWAMGNIPPWDSFWLDIPKDMIPTSIKKPIFPTQSKPLSRREKKRVKLGQHPSFTSHTKNLCVLSNIDDIKSQDFQTLKEAKQFFNQFGIFSKVGFGKYKDKTWAQLPASYYNSCQDFSFQRVSSVSKAKTNSQRVAIMSLVVDEYRKQIRRFRY